MVRRRQRREDKESWWWDVKYKVWGSIKEKDLTKKKLDSQIDEGSPVDKSVRTYSKGRRNRWRRLRKRHTAE